MAKGGAMYNKCIYILESISSLTPQFVTHFWSALKGEYRMYFSLEFVCKREIMADQKAMGSAMVCEGAPCQNGCVYVVSFSLEQYKEDRSGWGVNSSLIYRFVTHFWSPYRACIVYLFSLE